MSRAGLNLDDKEKKTILSMYGYGASYVDIAVQLGRNKSTIKRYIKSWYEATKSIQDKS